jgi:hypothetical protein
MSISLKPNGLDESGYHQTTRTSPILMSPAESQAVPFQSWSKPYGSFTSEFHNESGTPYSSKSAAAQEMLSAMGRGTQHFRRTFYAYRVTLPAGRENSYIGPYHVISVNYNGPYTCAAFVKRISGNLPTGWYMSGYDTNAGGWQLCGMSSFGSTTGYTHCHPYGASNSSACEFLIALPGVVYGDVDLSNARNWWLFNNQSGGNAVG